MSESSPPAKRRFYQNILDAYRLTARTYPALPWMLLGTAAVVIAIFMLVAWLSNTSWIGWLVVGLMGSLTAALALLSFLARRALFSQVEETAGAVKVALSQIQRGWVIPVSYTHLDVYKRQPISPAAFADVERGHAKAPARKKASRWCVPLSELAPPGSAGVHRTVQEYRGR